MSPPTAWFNEAFFFLRRFDFLCSQFLNEQVIASWSDSVLGLRKARSPACTRKHADMHLKNEEVILMSVPRLLFSCAVVHYQNDVSDQTGEEWMWGFYATDPQLSALPADRRRSCLNVGYGEQMTQRNAPLCGQTIHVCLHAESQNNGTCVREVLAFRHGWRLQWRWRPEG